MSHQPFEEWIFQDEVLSVEQRNMLQAHLDECSRCRQLNDSWEDIRSDLADPEMASPTPGFEARWRVRKAEQRRFASKRQISWMLGVTILTAGVLAIPLTMQILAMLEAPAVVGGSVIRDILEIDLTLRLTAGLIRALLEEVSTQLAPAGWAGLSVALLGFTTAWVLSLYRFAFRPIERGG
jgi:predicted anti-sigma-YlaC factor YlaD